ncbi:neprilysin-1-like [Glossina fuscipes fuscipes]
MERSALRVTYDNEGETPSVRIRRSGDENYRRNRLLELLTPKAKYAAVSILCLLLGAGFSTLIINYAASHCYNTEICLKDECVRTASYLLEAMDATIDPCDDFYRYACGGWQKKFLIPKDKGSISTFRILEDKVTLILKGLLEEPIKDEDNQATIKAKTMYSSCMDTAQIRKIGEDQLRQVIKSLGGWPVIETDWKPPSLKIEELLGKVHRSYGLPILSKVFVGLDNMNTSVYILKMDQPPFPLLSRDNYIKASKETLRKAYHRYMIKTATLLGAKRDTVAEELHHVLQFEIQLANATIPEEERFDVEKKYNKIILPELQVQIPEVNWTLYLQECLGPNITLRPNEELIVSAVPYLTEVSKIINRTDSTILYNSLVWRVVRFIAVLLVDEYERDLFEFNRLLLGVRSQEDHWNGCVESVNTNFGMATGALFIKDHFDPSSKRIALDMILTIREAFNELLNENPWMDSGTRNIAREKADAMGELIGYTDSLTNVSRLEEEYLNLTIVPDNYIKNDLSILHWAFTKNMQLLRKSAEKEIFTFNPTMINAFYDSRRNNIVFPAGILQPTFYNQHYPKSLNYGGIGTIIGHEITHGFDDTGRHFDKNGDVMQWWSNETMNTFDEHTQCMVDQYSEYKFEEIDQYVNGRFTLEENMADDGGVKQAFKAYKKWAEQHGPEPLLPGLNLTHEQLFFLNYAQGWCVSVRPENAILKLINSDHSPGQIRVRGTLANSKHFAEAYQCKPGSRMNPVKKCNVW